MDILFKYFEQGGNNSLSDKLLTKKLLILFLLLGAHRISTVKLFSVSNMVLNDLSVTFIPTEVLEHSRKGTNLWTYLNIDHIQILYHVLGNISLGEIRYVGLNMDQLIITAKKPFKGASVDIMRRWVKDIFILNNIVIFLLIAAGQPQRVKQRTCGSALMRY